MTGLIIQSSVTQVLNITSTIPTRKFNYYIQSAVFYTKDMSATHLVILSSVTLQRLYNTNSEAPKCVIFQYLLLLPLS